MRPTQWNNKIVMIDFPRGNLLPLYPEKRHFDFEVDPWQICLFSRHVTRYDDHDYTSYNDCYSCMGKDATTNNYDRVYYLSRNPNAPEFSIY